MAKQTRPGASASERERGAGGATAGRRKTPDRPTNRGKKQTPTTRGDGAAAGRRGRRTQTLREQRSPHRTGATRRRTRRAARAERPRHPTQGGKGRRRPGQRETRRTRTAKERRRHMGDQGEIGADGRAKTAGHDWAARQPTERGSASDQAAPRIQKTRGSATRGSAGREPQLPKDRPQPSPTPTTQLERRQGSRRGFQKGRRPFKGYEDLQQAVGGGSRARVWPNDPRAENCYVGEPDRRRAKDSSRGRAAAGGGVIFTRTGYKARALQPR